MGAALLRAVCAALAAPLPLRAAPPGNAYPIVQVHGVLGFGREELFGYKYWGGFTDLQALLREAGVQTHTATVGPVASSWDRACELYACIRGGRVDYGQEHAARHGHARFGREYPGLLPEWGAGGPTGSGGCPNPARKVHLIGHSLGGQTGRELIQLLAEGSPEARAATPPGELSPLFVGGKDWVASLSTIATPHDGTTMVCRYDLQRDFLKPLLSLWIAVSSTSEGLYYDFQLEQWGLERRPGESSRRYRKRVLGNAIWQNARDTAYWDGCPEGAQELNRWVPAHPQVYYFSWSAVATRREPLDGTQVPVLGMPASMASQARFMGSYTRAVQVEGGEVGVPIAASWWPSDGVVNTRSMSGPTLGSTDRIVPFAGTPLPGVFNHMGTLRRFDHLDVIGIPLHKRPPGHRSLGDWYLAHARLLACLPACLPAGH